MQVCTYAPQICYAQRTCTRMGITMKYLSKIKIYIPFVENSIKTSLAYRVSFLIRILSRFFTILVTYYLWKAIYSSSTDSVLGGFSFREMVTYIIISFFTTIIVNSELSDYIAYDVLDGSIAASLIKPMNYRATIFAQSIGTLVLNFSVLVLPFMIIFCLIGWIDIPTITNGILYMISLFLSFLNNFLFGCCFSIVAFHTTYYFGINMAKTVVARFFSGSIIPLTFFPLVFENVFKILPFSSMNYTPTMIYLGKLRGQDLVQAISLQLVWIVIFCFINKFLWNHAIKRLTILGG